MSCIVLSCVCVCIFVLFYAMSKCSVLYDLLAASGNMRYWARNISINHSLKLCTCSTSLVHSLSLSLFLSLFLSPTLWLIVVVSKMFIASFNWRWSGGNGGNNEIHKIRTNEYDWMNEEIIITTHWIIHSLFMRDVMTMDKWQYGIQRQYHRVMHMDTMHANITFAVQHT